MTRYWYLIWFIIGVTVGLLIPTNHAHAQGQMCGPREQIITSLEHKYNEDPVSIMLASNGAVIEVLASPNGSFTILMTQTNGISCVMAAGQSYERLPLVPEDEEVEG